MQTSVVIIIISAVVILSYFFSYLSIKSKIPAVLLLMAAGIVVKQVLLSLGIDYTIPPFLIEFLGEVGIIMIVLEAGLDLQIGRKKTIIIKRAVFSAIVILVISVALLTTLLVLETKAPILNCIVYSVPISIISSSIVLPSLQHLSEDKKDFLVYEASLSDVLGILLFNFLTAQATISVLTGGLFLLNIVLAVILALFVSFLIFFLFTRTIVNVKFFLAMAILILLYTVGRMVNLPALITILIFGIIITNWEKIKHRRLTQMFPDNQIKSTHGLFQSITAESSFLIRTFFFTLFGYSIKLNTLADMNILIGGTVVVAILLLVRFLYLVIFVKTNIFPELFFIPRGLVTILLYYNIPPKLKLPISEGILFFVILATSLIMMMGSMLHNGGEKQ